MARNKDAAKAREDDARRAAQRYAMRMADALVPRAGRSSAVYAADWNRQWRESFIEAMKPKGGDAQ